MNDMLKIDIDFKPPKKWWPHYKEFITKGLEGLGYSVTDIRIVPSDKKGHHAFIDIQTPKRITNNKKIMLQWLCTDDQGRVWHYIKNVKRKEKHWNLMYHKIHYRDGKIKDPNIFKNTRMFKDKLVIYKIKEWWKNVMSKTL